MFCYIQEITLKNTSTGYSKRLETITHTFQGKTIYSYAWSEEKFIRPKNIAYKISIHHSYRENGKVKKKQWYITTMNYYDIAEGFGLHDVLWEVKLNKILEETGLSLDDFYILVYEKLGPLTESIINEFQQTNEYKTHKRHQSILAKYQQAKSKFEKVYGTGTYSECYDVFGKLQNPQRFYELMKEYEKKKEQQRSYYEQQRRNYNNYNNYSSYKSTTSSNYTEQEKKLLKEAFKLLAMKYHPDRNQGKDTTETMAAINNLKEKILK